jgi:arginase
VTATRPPRFIAVPQSLGREHARFGSGVHLLADTLAAGDVTRLSVPPGGELATEISDSFAAVRELASAVRETAAAGATPVVLAVNCFSALGTVAGLDTPDDLGVVWFDGHSDFDTPERTDDGFIDGMGLAMLTGHGWETLRSTVPGLRPVPGPRTVLAGAPKLGRDEDEALAAAGVVHVPPRGPLTDTLNELAERARGVYLHVDLDVLDPSEGRANMVARDGAAIARAVLDRAVGSAS